MSKFNLSKKLDLEKFGEGSYLEFSLVTYADARKIQKLGITEDNPDNEKATQAAIDLLKEKFISGKLPGDKGELVDVTKVDLEELPIEIIGEAINFLSGGLNKTSANQ